MGFGNFDISTVLASVVAIAIAISVHEFGHAFAAHLLGDDTAKDEGRMSLNPMNHVDPIGIIMLFIFKFGWAKPVPVNPNNYKNYRVGNFIVSMAGVIFNIITAIICLYIMKYVHIYSVYTVMDWTVAYCLGLAAFNLLPIPPLDGWGVLTSFIPNRYSGYLYQYERYGFFILLLALFTGVYGIILNPIYNVILNIIQFFVI
ncbi:site-2 protease family protein [Clostridioides mangenotii]|uniref:site-2 protease family protein n=1 Tax=Metaclostridioides mangenotii TaxID=1540 RepID=UPI001C0F7E91|nr:site-2 protease family protein [Clostridioides mangenotii]MBU5306539.1 site-2 protease family protein [Clostridioides mangenotii]MCR1955834.1 site-2 protease family protein [Clostridioides mangenotii]